MSTLKNKPPEAKTLNHYWCQIVTQLTVHGDKREAARIFLFVINMYRSRGVSSATRDYEDNTEEVLREISAFLRQQMQSMNHSAKQRKIPFRNLNIEREIDKLVTPYKQTEANFFDKTSQFLKVGSGLQPVLRAVRRK